MWFVTGFVLPAIGAVAALCLIVVAVWFVLEGNHPNWLRFITFRPSRHQEAVQTAARRANRDIAFIFRYATERMLWHKSRR